MDPLEGKPRLRVDLGKVMAVEREGRSVCAQCWLTPEFPADPQLVPREAAFSWNIHPLLGLQAGPPVRTRRGRPMNN